MPANGAIAAGHPATVRSAAQVLSAGGNAFDACVAAIATACVVEPVLASLGGGGYVLALPARERARVYDFFVQTPCVKQPESELEFRSVVADFGGGITQEFHVGAGAVATPGLVRGIFDLHADLCRVPVPELLAPAVDLARGGVAVREFDSGVMDIVGAIFRDSPDCFDLYASPADGTRLLQPGDTLIQPALATAIEAIGHEGADLFYRGEIAQRLCDRVSSGGHLTGADLSGYRTQVLAPAEVPCHGARLCVNPSAGGLLLAFAMALAGDARLADPGTAETLIALAEVIVLSSEARALMQARDGHISSRLLAPELIAQFRATLEQRQLSRRGTTHISIIDRDANVASATLSNGECSGLVVRDTGITLNNMLGEEDLNPGGFHRWPTDQRMTSMMAPAALRFDDGGVIALGSGGSNRIRSALMQVLVNLLHFESSVEQAVCAPRIHVEKDLLSIEGGHDIERLGALLEAWPRHELFAQRSMFFGGAHVVRSDGRGGFDGAGDPRRGGSWALA